MSRKIHRPDYKDDFALYINKDWSLNAELPDGFASITPLSECDLIVQERMRKLLADDSLTGYDAVFSVHSQCGQR